MSARVQDAVVTTRRFRPEDGSAVLELLRASLGEGPGGDRSAAFFRWKHLENPFGSSFMLLAEADGRIVGLRAFMRWRFEAGGVSIPAVRAVDTATHPDHQGRGIFSRLTLEALDALREDTAIVFNTPNEKSLPGYLKMGWGTVGRVPIGVRVRRPARFLAARGGRAVRAPEMDEPIEVGAAPAGRVLASAGDLDGLLAVSGPASWSGSGAIATPRTRRYLEWRYGEAPLLDYRAIVEEGAHGPDGLAIFRVRRRGSLRESTVSEVIVRAGDRATAGRLLRRVGRAARVDHVACAFPIRSVERAAAVRSGFLRSPGGMLLVARPLGDGLVPDPMDLRSWALTVGDLEVF